MRSRADVISRFSGALMGPSGFLTKTARADPRREF